MSLESPGPPETPAAAPALNWRARVRAALPFVVTALIAVTLSWVLQVNGRPGAAAEVPAALVTPTMLVRPTSTSAPPASTAPVGPLPDERILSQEIVDLRAAVDELRSALFLMRAANQLGDAETVLRSNDLPEVERLLVTVKVSLDRAYDYSAEQNKGPIGEFRLQVGRMREDLRVRPEGIDQRMRRLRQEMLNLAEPQG